MMVVVYVSINVVVIVGHMDHDKNIWLYIYKLASFAEAMNFHVQSAGMNYDDWRVSAADSLNAFVDVYNSQAHPMWTWRRYDHFDESNIDQYLVDCERNIRMGRGDFPDGEFIAFVLNPDDRDPRELKFHIAGTSRDVFARMRRNQLEMTNTPENLFHYLNTLFRTSI
jgi:hypothetical protein